MLDFIEFGCRSWGLEKAIGLNIFYFKRKWIGCGKNATLALSHTHSYNVLQ